MMAASETSPGVVRVGRPRDSAIDVAVLEATLTALFSVGYTRLSLEDVARQAGTTKPAIRRRWPGRPHLVLAALASRLGTVKAPDTGCTLCDLYECLKLFAQAFQCISPDVLGPLLADCAGAPELRETFMATLFEPPRTAVEWTLANAYERGDLRKEVDPAIVLDLLGSFVYYRVLFSHLPVDDREIERAVDTLLRGVAGDYDHLLEHSRQASALSEMHSLHA
jgi:AcrR family transcriptional regulator